MEPNREEQSRGPLYRLKSSFNEIFGKPDRVTTEVKEPRDRTDSKTFEKIE